MSLTSVSPITGRGVPPSLHTRQDGQSNDRHPGLGHIRYIFSSNIYICSPAISSYIQNDDSTTIYGPLKPGLIQRNICIMAFRKLTTLPSSQDVCLIECSFFCKHKFSAQILRPEENTTACILLLLSEAKLAYHTAWAMGEEGKVVSFLKRFTDRAFAGHLLRTIQANTLRTATLVALEKEAERKKEHHVMDKEPIEVGAAEIH